MKEKSCSFKFLAASAMVMFLLPQAFASFSFSGSNGIWSGSNYQSVSSWSQVSSDDKIAVGYTDQGSLEGDGGSVESLNRIYVGHNHYGELSLSGEGTTLNVNGSENLSVGMGASGLIEVLSGAALNTNHNLVIGDGDLGEMTINNGTVNCTNHLIFNYKDNSDNSSITITNGGSLTSNTYLYTVNNTANLTIEDGSASFENIYAAGSSVTNVNIGLEGSIYLAGGGDSIDSFIEAISKDSNASFELKLWNDGAYVSYSSLQENTDYFVSDGMITVPEPCSIMLFSLGGMLLRRKTAV
ncbi:hypothetical protein L21SP3_01079 [Sedimentisphaera cyanobacteriorum]|uniref:PEP-CTERM protein-sorting domain-containing protein n=1 Tax=Sedimentisphaera cyanobacteriorum TaxID=1940790 RepID=A0A1Q2HPV2_9BACT|nr:hypothetical protein [Sedimentisphaera cyanobacteriorum]AQQ09276.1 hypothetical protein L21SP3_01079 [Sedimentisphaera cyanobacteriorum]